MRQDIYRSGEYWSKNETFHEEDGHYKAEHCFRMLNDYGLTKDPLRVLDIGCGGGRFLYHLSDLMEGEFLGIDVSDQSIGSAIAKHSRKNLSYERKELAQVEGAFDLVTMNDVFEHVDDYIGFLTLARPLGRLFYFNIPLDMTVLSVFRGSYMKWREDVGHLHYFSKESALATLEYAGFDLVAHRYNNYVLHEVKTRPTIKNILGALPRLATYAVAPDFSVSTLGGASLGVLCRGTQ